MARRAGRKTDYTWQGVQVGFPLAANGQAAATVLNLDISGTIYRSRGSLIASIDGPTATDACTVFFGLYVATEEQVAVGVTSMPNPGADFDADFIWHGAIPLLAQGVVEDQFATSGRLVIDSKAMRKFKQTMNLVLLASNSVTTGTPIVDVEGYYRGLLGI